MTTLQYWNCSVCGKKCSRKPVRGQRPKYCGSKCAAARRDERVRAQVYKCNGCGSNFSPNDYRDRFCSFECHVAHRDVSNRRKSLRDRVLSLQAKAAQGTRSKRIWVAGGCGWCGSYTVGLGRFCSRKCSKYSYESKKPTKSLVSPVVRRRVYARDNWVCQICFDPVDREADYRTSWAPSLDHIEPQSASIIPDHSEDNLRLVHMLCNSYRRDMPVEKDHIVRELISAL